MGQSRSYISKTSIYNCAKMIIVMSVGSAGLKKMFFNTLSHGCDSYISFEASLHWCVRESCFLPRLDSVIPGVVMDYLSRDVVRQI